MKCPKCGSVMKGVYDRRYNRKCFNCGTMKKVDIKELEHQQRLDSVLSKFESVWDSQEPYKQLILHTKDDCKKLVGGIWKKMKTISYLYKEDSSEQFYLIVDFYLDNVLENTYEIERSLDTVESLIKDLEDNDG